MIQQSIRKVAIVGYNRIPFARAHTAYARIGNREMLRAALDGLITACRLDGVLLGEVAGGAVVKLSDESNLVRECVLETSLDPATAACDLQQACTTGIEAAVYIANKIALGQIESGIACGVDSASNPPVVLSDALRRALLQAKRGKGFKNKISPFLSLRPGDLLPVVQQGREPRSGKTMGEHTELTAKFYGISREEQDALALKSHQNMAKAADAGFFDDMISPFMGLSADNNLRRDTSAEKLARLKPAFDPDAGTLTAGNSTPLTDGAACVLLATEAWAAAHGLPVLAYISTAEVAAISYLPEEHNLLLAPVIAVSRLLERSGLTLQSFDFYELHEAFAAQVLATLKIWESPELSRSLGLPAALGPVDRSRLNVTGSSIAAAHPFAATGGRILATLAKLLQQKGSGRGLISICAARGQGVAMILER